MAIRPRPLRCPGLRRIFVALAGLVSGLAAEPAPTPASNAEAGLPFIDVFDPREYRGHAEISTIVQGPDGLVYFGNYGQVLFYDGARWDRIEVPGTAFVRGLAFDAHGTLWIGGVNELGYAELRADGTRGFVSLRDRLPAEARDFSDLWHIMLTPHGVVFQATNWLFRWDGTHFDTLALAPGTGWNLVDANGTLIVSQPNAGWWVVRDDGRALSLEPLARPEAYETSSLFFCFPGNAPGETIFGTTTRGLIRWDGKSFTPFTTEVDDLLKEKTLYSGMRLPGGRIALGTWRGGAVILDPQGRLLVRLNEDTGVPDNGVRATLSGRAGELWLGLRRGIARVDTRAWLTWFDQRHGAPTANLTAPRRFHGDLYLGTSSGLLQLSRATAGNPAQLVPVPGIADSLSGLTIEGDSLFGYGLGPLIEWRNGRRVPLPRAGIQVFNFVPSHAQPGRWFAVVDDGVCTYRREGGGWKLEGRVPGIQTVRAIVETPDGAWWMGTSVEGVLRVTFPAATAETPGQPVIARFVAGSGLPAGHGWTRVLLQGGRLLMQCEKGFFRFDEATQSFRPTAEFGEQFADGTATTRTLADDPRDGVWIVSRPADQSQFVTDITLGLATPHGWQAVHLPELARIDDVYGLTYDEATDSLWLAGHAGLVRLDLATWRAAPPEARPTLIVRRMATLAGETLPLAGGWRLPYAKRSFHVQFAAPLLSGDAGARYESTLLGDGDPIVQVDAMPQREFSALSSGHYTLRLRARSGGGAWSVPVEISFRVLPPWWRSGWAWGGYLLAGVAAVTLFARSRTRALRHRAAQLETTVAARTEDLRRSNEELARLNRLELDEKTAAKLAEEKARLELLRYQLNPHFLLNAFTTLRGLVFSRPEAAGEMVGKLAEFCRFALTRTDQSGGTVADEVKLIETYLATEKSRWRDELVCSVELDPAIADVRLPPFLLQPLVENAVKYGGRTSPEKLEVRVRLAGDGAAGLRLEVANTGAWVEAGSEHHVATSTGLGLENLRQRLRRYYPGCHTLEISPEPGWVKIVLHLSQPARDPFATTHPAH